MHNLAQRMYVLCVQNHICISTTGWLKCHRMQWNAVTHVQFMARGVSSPQIFIMLGEAYDHRNWAQTPVYSSPTSNFTNKPLITVFVITISTFMLEMGRRSDFDIRPKPKVWAGSPNECQTFGRTSAECCVLG